MLACSYFDTISDILLILKIIKFKKIQNILSVDIFKCVPTDEFPTLVANYMIFHLNVSTRFPTQFSFLYVTKQY